MAALTNPQRRSIWAEFMRRASRERQDLGLTKTQLRAAVDATDGWIDDNAASFNSALPAAARTALTAQQKALMFFAVASKRFEVN